jgi:hypothetical protein
MIAPLDDLNRAAGVLREDGGALILKLSATTDLLLIPAQREWCGFIAEKVRSTSRSRTAEQLILKDHRFGEKRPPFVTGYYETYKPGTSRSSLSAPDPARTERGIETADGVQELDIIVGRLASTGIGARCAWASAGAARARGHREDGPTTSSASRPRASPTSSSRADRTRPPATTRATTATRSTSSPRRWPTCATTATTRSRSTRRPKSAGARWSTPQRGCRRRSASAATFSQHPGRRHSPNPGGPSSS